MRTRHSEYSPSRDEQRAPAGGDKFARESNTWRRMRPWHIWTAAIAAAVFIVVGIAIT